MTLHPYATLAYAHTLAHVGRPVHSPAWQTYVVARDWRGQAEDIIGPYPLTCLAADSDLQQGISDLRKAGFVSATMVVDGLTGPSISKLQGTFTFVRPFKTHYLIDEAVGPYQPTKHHRDRVRRAARRGVAVRQVALRDIVEDWTVLYENLIQLHHVIGPPRFSRESFVALAECVGLVTVGAFMGRELVSCNLWFEHEGIVWSHLAASNARGYANSAAFAAYDESIRMFSGRLINLGGAAGVSNVANDGLAAFKCGFSNRTSTAYLVGNVLDPPLYNSLCANHQRDSDSQYFPAYRAPTTLGDTP